MTAHEDPRDYQFAESDDPAVFMALAVELQTAISQRLDPNTENARPTAIDLVVDDALRDVATRLIDDKIAGLDPVAFAELYANAHGTGALLERLEEIRALQQQDLERQIGLAKIERDARVSGILRLGQLAAGEVITIGLFDASRPALAAKHFADDSQHRPLYRTMRWRLDEPESGHGELLSDNWQAPIWATVPTPELIEPHRSGNIGSLRHATDGARVAAEISLHSTVAYILDDDPVPTSPEQIVGFVETADGRLLLNGK